MERNSTAGAIALATTVALAAAAGARAQAPATEATPASTTHTTPVRCVETVVERGVEQRRDAWAAKLAWTPPVLVVEPGRAWTFAADGVGTSGSLSLDNMDARTIRYTIAVPNGSIRTVVRDEVPLEFSTSAMDVGALRTLECR